MIVDNAEKNIFTHIQRLGGNPQDQSPTFSREQSLVSQISIPNTNQNQRQANLPRGSGRPPAHSSGQHRLATNNRRNNTINAGASG